MKKMPKPALDTKSSPMCIEEVLRGAKEVNKQEYPWADRFVGRFPVPDWQRPLCWSMDQNVSLIESVFLGYDIGSWLVNHWDMNDKTGIMLKNSDIVIDGQQRINALILYSDDEFPVFGANFSELHIRDKRRFLNHIFVKRETKTFDENILKETYNRLNFGGVAHSVEQMAV